MQNEPDSRHGAPQIAIVLKDGQWFIRRLAWIHQDDVSGEMIYHCDEHLGGPFSAWSDMAKAVDAYLVSNC